MFWDSTDWDKEGDERVFKEEAKDKKAFAQDASDYRAVLLTKKDFGCVAWEP
jgi:hypothetical protein